MSMPPDIPASTDALGDSPPALERSTRQLAKRGMVWTVLSYGASQVLRFGGHLVLARLLAPEIFGQMLLVNVFSSGLQMFSDLGLGASIIQNKRGEDPAFRNTAWTIQVLRGALLFAAAAVLAAPYARLYDNPALAWYVVASAVSALVSGFNATGLYTLNRRLSLGRLAILDLGAQAFGIAVMVGWALVQKSVWPLVGGGIASALFRAIATRMLTEHRDRFAWEPEAARDLLRFGRAVFLSTALLFLADQSQTLLLGKLVDKATLGIYSVALTLATMGTVVVQKIMSDVMFATFAILFRDRPDRALYQYGRTRYLVVGGAAVMALGIIVLAPFIVHLLYDRRYWDVTWMLQALALLSAVDIMRAPAAWLLLAAGKPGYSVWASAARVVVIGAGLPLAMHLGGLRSGIWVIALSSVPTFLIFSFGVAHAFPELARRERIVSGLVVLAVIAIVLFLVNP